MKLNEVVFVDEEETDYPDIRSSAIKCICPKCRTNHKVRLLWTGRGTPRKFCNTCRKSLPAAGLLAAAPSPSLQKALYGDF